MYFILNSSQREGKIEVKASKYSDERTFQVYRWLYVCGTTGITHKLGT